MKNNFEDILFIPQKVHFFDIHYYYHFVLLACKAVIESGVAVIRAPQDAWTFAKGENKINIKEYKWKLGKIQKPTHKKVDDGVYFQYHSTLNISLTPYQFYEKSKQYKAVSKTVGDRVLQPSKNVTEITIDEYESMIFNDDFLLNNDQVYGYDFNHTLFKEDQIAWNLQNFVLHQNPLLHSSAESKGVNIPSLLFGTGGSTFILHVEDYHLAAINYLHWGDPKVWYVVPETHIKEVHKLIKNLYGPHEDFNGVCANFLEHKTCLISPKILRNNNIPFRRIIQRAKEYVIVRPGCFHMGFNTGSNISEACNFVSLDWPKLGKIYERCSCGEKEPIEIDIEQFYQLENINYEKFLNTTGSPSRLHDQIENCSINATTSKTNTQPIKPQDNIIKETKIEYIEVPIVEDKKCTICAKKISRTNDLKEHMRTHTGERVYCPCCEKNYAQKAGVNKHLRNKNTNCYNLNEAKKLGK